MHLLNITQLHRVRKKIQKLKNVRGTGYIVFQLTVDYIPRDLYAHSIVQFKGLVL